MGQGRRRRRRRRIIHAFASLRRGRPRRFAPIGARVDRTVWPSAAGTRARVGRNTHRARALLYKLVPKIEPEAPAAAEGAPAAATEPKMVSYDQFAAIDLRVGIVHAAEKVPKKDKLLRLSVDLGEDAPRQIVAGLARSFTPNLWA